MIIKMCFEKNNIPCSEEQNCKLCYERSFTSVDKASFWSDKNKLKPWQIKKGSSKKFWFKCDKSDKEKFIQEQYENYLTSSTQISSETT
jgi:hypothetical protein